MATKLRLTRALLFLSLTPVAACNFAPGPGKIAPVTRLPAGFSEHSAAETVEREEPMA